MLFPKVITQFQFINKLEACVCFNIRILFLFLAISSLTSCQNNRTQFKKAINLTESTVIDLNKPLPYLKGVNILRKLIAKNYTPAMDYLAFMHERGFYVTKSPDSAYLLYRKAAVHGDEYACRVIKYSQYPKCNNSDNISDCYLKAVRFRFGLDCSLNSDSMLFYYERSAESGDIFSLSMLGDVLFYGIAETEDGKSKALKWYYANKMLQDTIDFDMLDIMEIHFGYLMSLENCKDSALVWLKKYYPDKFPEEQNDTISSEEKTFNKLFATKK